jgi:hypothetical protein
VVHALIVLQKMRRNTVIRQSLLDDAGISKPLLILYCVVTVILLAIWPIFWPFALASFAVGVVAGIGFTESIRRDQVRLARFLRTAGFVTLIVSCLLIYLTYGLSPQCTGLIAFGSYTGFSLVVALRSPMISERLFMGELREIVDSNKAAEHVAPSDGDKPVK